MADTPDLVPQAAASPANGVSVSPPAGAPIAAAPIAEAPAAAVPPPKESWFKGFDWMRVIGYTVLIIVGVAYVKYTQNRAKKDASDITDLKTQLSTLSSEVDGLKPE